MGADLAPPLAGTWSPGGWRWPAALVTPRGGDGEGGPGQSPRLILSQLCQLGQGGLWRGAPVTGSVCGVVSCLPWPTVSSV